MSEPFDSGPIATLAFFLASALTIASAIIVVTQKDLVRAVLALAMSFVGVAAIYFILNAEFIGVVQILVYVGAISILIAFSVMFIGDLANAGTLSQSRIVSAAAGVLLFAAIIFVAYNTEWTSIEEVTDADAVAGLISSYEVSDSSGGDNTIVAASDDSENTRGGVLVDSPSHIGPALISDFILPFETLGLLLIAALIGALLVIRGRQEDDA